MVTSRCPDQGSELVRERVAGSARVPLEGPGTPEPPVPLVGEGMPVPCVDRRERPYLSFDADLAGLLRL